MSIGEPFINESRALKITLKADTVVPNYNIWATGMRSGPARSLALANAEARTTVYADNQDLGTLQTNAPADNGNSNDHDAEDPELQDALAASLSPSEFVGDEHDADLQAALAASLNDVSVRGNPEVPSSDDLARAIAESEKMHEEEKKKDEKRNVRMAFVHHANLKPDGFRQRRLAERIAAILAERKEDSQNAHNDELGAQVVSTSSTA